MTFLAVQAQMQKVFGDRKDVAMKLLDANKEFEAAKGREQELRQVVSAYEHKLKTIKNDDLVHIISYKVVAGSLNDKRCQLDVAVVATQVCLGKLHQLQALSDQLEGIYRSLETVLNKSDNNILEF